MKRIGIKEQFAAVVAMAIVPGLASAQTVSNDKTVNDIVGGVCKLISPFLGQSKFLSIVFLISLAVIAFLWWISENKEGMVVWLLRTGVAIGILINIFTLPTLIGLPNPCGSVGAFTVY